MAAARRWIRSLASRRRVGSAAPEVEQLEPEFVAAYERCAAFTMTSRERMYALWHAAKYVRRLDGDYVECGVWRGGSSMLAALALDSRTMWLYDTYEGMSEPGPEDVAVTGLNARESWEEIRREDGQTLARASLEDVQANMAGLGIDPSIVRYVKGKVEDTIPSQAPERIALLRLDTDWYASTRHELEHLWPRLVPGGVLIIDDYGHWQGARRAVDEFFAARDDAPLLVRVDYTGRVAIKV